jgi:hypothetical protein
MTLQMQAPIENSAKIGGRLEGSNKQMIVKRIVSPINMKSSFGAIYFLTFFLVLI